MTTALHVSVQPVRRQYQTIDTIVYDQTDNAGNDSFVESTLAMATLFLLRTVVARSELLLLCHVWCARA